MMQEGLSGKPLGGVGGQPLDLTNGVQLVSIGVPVGTIIDYAGNNIPAGWLKCDGSSYNPSTYPELKAVLGRDTVPDLRNYFTRGGSGATPYTHHQDTTRTATKFFYLQTAKVATHDHKVGNIGNVLECSHPAMATSTQ